ncbi:hypothetical protein NKI20_32720 [Mesorhizobium sp. M0830]|uniref:hypothetical protein n=1 Tax=Mesorhizobium sp. M0830 TaxID=2957008 RepID=UPI003334BC5B
MSSDKQEKHPFLDDLADDAELSGTVMRRSVSGRDHIKRLVEAVGTLYASQTPTFYGAIGQRHFLQYQATLRNGLKLEAVGVIERDDAGLVQRVTMTFAPLDAAVVAVGGIGRHPSARIWRRSFLRRDDQRGRRALRGRSELGQDTEAF